MTIIPMRFKLYARTAEEKSYKNATIKASFSLVATKSPKPVVVMRVADQYIAQ
jgi:hypothetical protein